MKKIIEFLKENWIGGTVGGVYFFLGVLTWIFAELKFLGYDFATFSTTYWFTSLTALPEFFALFVISFLEFDFIALLIAGIISVVVGIFIGAFVQKLIQHKRYIIFMICVASVVILNVIILNLIALDSLTFKDDYHPSRCQLQAGLYCEDFHVTRNSLQLTIQNGLGKDIIISSIKSQNCEELINQGLFVKGNHKTYSLACLNKGSKYDGEVNISYIGPDTKKHTNLGQIITRIES